MRESLVETLIGLAVVAVAGFFLWFSMSEGGDASISSDQREFGARFSSVSGISRGADVRVAGVKVGLVQSIGLDRATNEAEAVLVVDSSLNVFDDAVARIQTDGLLGGAYIALDPGYDAFELGPVPVCGAEDALFDGSGCSMITNTQGSVDLLTLFASFASGSGGGDDQAPADDPYGYPE
ncbi:MAG: MlaD family protein [Pseudomonadota bacterium]